MKDWKTIHLGFTPEFQKEWENRDFTYEEAEKWVIDAELAPADANFACWLRDAKNFGPKSFFNREQLEKEYQSKSKEEEDKKTLFKNSLFKAVKENNIREVRQIIESGEIKDINFCDEYGNTLLHYATKKDSLLLLKFLVRKGGDVNAVNNYGWTVLHSAALEIVNDQGDWGIVEFLLLESRVNIDIKTESGLTARSIFFQKDYSYIEQYDNLVEQQVFFQQEQVLIKEK
jgi:hypothetical protein